MNLQNPGDTCCGFKLTKVSPLDELSCILRELVHEKTGAKVISIENDDPENLFSLSFQTLPSNSRGVAHVLEHIVLCGSEKFPVKDPFFAMTRRSLNTYMNALTGADFTCYPAASQVEKDFYNLLEVYLDAVFHPKLEKFSFLQEGHRLEFADPENSQSPLEIKGVVYNEMKGSLSSPDSRLWHAMMEFLVPDLPYAFNSGGDPKEIPKLSYEELKEFHSTFYHPCRCLFFFYGNLPLEKHLGFIEEKELSKAAPATPMPSIPQQPRFLKPRVEKMRYPVLTTKEPSDQTIIALGWLTAPVLKQEEILALSILDSLWMDTDASLLKRKLLSSGKLRQADAFMDIEMSEVPYLIVCKGCKKDSALEVELTVKKALEELLETEIPFSLIESALHQLEFSRTEITGDGAPYGLSLFMRAALAKQHGCEPENALKIHSQFANLRKRAKDPTFIPSLIKKYFLNNCHLVCLEMDPDPKLSEEEDCTEKKRLEKIKAALSEQEKKEIVDQASKLAEYQKKMEKQGVDCLPKVELSDIPSKVRLYPLDHHPSPIYHHAAFTNKILYTELIFDLPSLSDEELLYLPLLLSFFSEVGVGTRSYIENLNTLQAYTGGIGATCSLNVQIKNPKLLNPTLHVRGKALFHNTEKLFSLLYEMSSSLRFDEKERIEELLLQLHTSLETRLSKSAMRYAIHLALSGFSPASKIQNQWQGLPFFYFVQSLVRQLPEKRESLITKLNNLKDKVLCLKDPNLLITCDLPHFQTIENHKYYNFSSLQGRAFAPWNNQTKLEPVKSQLRPTSAPGAYLCQAFKTISYLAEEAPALMVAGPLLENCLLHRKIREQGGAYGCGASYNPMSGHFYFHSYRDPHIARTVKTFERGLVEIAAKKFDDSDLEEAKLSTIQGFDIPISPGSRASVSYSYLREGKTNAMRQHFRDKVLFVTSEEVAKAVETLLKGIKSSVFVCFAGKELIDKEMPKLEKEGIEAEFIPL